MQTPRVNLGLTRIGFVFYPGEACAQGAPGEAGFHLFTYHKRTYAKIGDKLFFIFSCLACAIDAVATYDTSSTAMANPSCCIWDSNVKKEIFHCAFSVKN